MRIRRARASDAPAIARHRAGMFRDMGLLGRRHAMAFERRACLEVRREIVRGGYLGWLAVADGRIIGGVGVMPRRMLPRPSIPRGHLEAYVLNLYVEPDWRRKGVARALMAAVLAWARRRRIPLASLHASEMGRPLYRGMGFKPTNEMRLILKGAKD